MQSAKNLERASRVDGVFHAYLKVTGMDFCSPRDLLCDILHWCARERVDFDREVTMAHTFYWDEK